MKFFKRKKKVEICDPDYRTPLIPLDPYNQPIRWFVKFCETKAERPLGVRMMIATEVCQALGLTEKNMDILKHNVATKF